jgi:DNA-damage-inducible protein J
MTTTQIGIRIDENEKKELEKNAKALGLTASSAIKMMIAKFNYDKGFSVPMTTKDSLDNYQKLPPEVEKAMFIAKGEELGLIKDTSEPVTDFEKLKDRWQY